MGRVRCSKPAAQCFFLRQAFVSLRRGSKGSCSVGGFLELQRMANEALLEASRRRSGKVSLEDRFSVSGLRKPFGLQNDKCQDSGQIGSKISSG
jgi:hypothetical protein